MDILLKFYLVKKGKKENKFLFWSCVLNTNLDDVDVDFLNKNNNIKIDGFDKYFINITYSIYENFDKLIEENKEKYHKEYLIERPEYFLPNDKTYQKGSPYKQASCLVKHIIKTQIILLLN